MVGIGLAGIGGWGKNHLRVLATLKAMGEIDYLAIADIDRDAIAYYKKIYSIDKAYNNLDDLVGDEDVDAGIIATPTPLHYKHAMTFIEEGKSVLVEKPFTSTIEEATELIEIGKEKKLTIGVGLLLRYSPAVQYIRKLFSEGRLGNILGVSAKRTSYWPERKLDVEVIRDLAIHDVDLVTFITSYEPKKVLAHGGSSLHNLIDYASMLYIYQKDNGESLPVSIEVSWITPYKTRRFEITTTKGTISLDLLNHTVEWADDTGIKIPSIKYKEPLLEQDLNFVRAVKGNEELVAKAEDVILPLKACLKALQSIEEKRAIEI